MQSLTEQWGSEAFAVDTTQLLFTVINVLTVFVIHPNYQIHTYLQTKFLFLFQFTISSITNTKAFHHVKKVYRCRPKLLPLE
jgi:hypothetical protein